jgi:oligopeptide/dipeptide ABC transporter ATP-binding protein
MGSAADILEQPLHPYTRGLFACLPRLDQLAPPRPIPGETPTSGADVPGCAFHPRCNLREARCETQGPLPREISPSRKVACHVVGNDLLRRDHPGL